MLRRSPPDPTPGRPVSRVGLVGVLALCLALVATAVACSEGGSTPEATPPTSFALPDLDDVAPIPTVTVPEGFVLVDARGVRLLPFESSPKATVPALPVYGGNATIGGRVTSSNGPVPNATVLIERLADDRSGAITVPTAADGTFQALKVLGGKYRVRAWLAPTLAATESQLAFLADDEVVGDLDITVEAFQGRQLQVGLDVTALNVGDPARVRALLTEQVVDAEGIVVGLPVAGAKIVLSRSGWFDLPQPDATTDAQGMASWPVRCRQEGTTTFTAVAEGATDSFTTPSCGPKPVPSTTTTTVPAFAVGQEFKVPRAEAVPAGRYETTTAGCKTSYQVYVNDTWQADRRTSDTTLSLPGPARDFKPAGGPSGCSYRRTA